MIFLIARFTRGHVDSRACFRSLWNARSVTVPMKSIDPKIDQINVIHPIAYVKYKLFNFALEKRLHPGLYLFYKKCKPMHYN